MRKVAGEECMLPAGPLWNQGGARRMTSPAGVATAADAVPGARFAVKDAGLFAALRTVYGNGLAL